MLIINKIENFSYYGKSNYKYYYNSYSVINRRISYAIYRESADNNLCNRTTSYMKSMKQCVEDISKYGGKAIISGQDFSIYSFSATDLDSICEKINGIWYYEDKNISDFNDNVSFDENHAKNFGEYSLEYLRGISPKYNRERLTKSLLPKVSGDFYVDIYQPIQNVLYEYEYWMKKEKYFKNLAFVTISGNILFMLVILMFHQYLPICIAYLLCIICSGLLIYELYELMRIEKLAKEIMR